MSSLRSIQKAVRDWISGAVNGGTGSVPVLWSDQGLPIPASPHVILDMTTGPANVGRDVARFPALRGSLGTSELRDRQQTFDLSIHVWRKKDRTGTTEPNVTTAHDLMMRIFDATNDEDAKMVALNKRQTYRLQVATVTAGATYTVWVNGEPISITAPTPATATSVRNLLKTALQTNVFTRAILIVADDGTDALTVSAQDEFFQTTTDGKLALTTVQEAVNVAVHATNGPQDLSDVVGQDEWEHWQGEMTLCVGRKAITAYDDVERVEVEVQGTAINVSAIP